MTNGVFKGRKVGLAFQGMKDRAAVAVFVATAGLCSGTAAAAESEVVDVMVEAAMMAEVAGVAEMARE